MDETKKAADELATKGFIDSGRRRNLYGLKQQYNQNVVPLQNQLKIRQERADMLYKMKLQNPTYRATLDPNSIALTAGLKDPNAFNFDGVAGSDLYNSAAKKLEQLSKTITQDIPELKRMPKLSFQYFTAIQSGATPEQAANAMKREGFDPTTVDKMTNMIHGTIDSTMQEFGVYDKFKNDPKTIEELWNTTSQAAYSAIGTKQFGNVTDSWGQALATKKLNEAPPEEKLIYSQSMNTPVFDEGYRPNNITELINGNPIFNKDGSIGNVSDIAGVFGGNIMKNLMQKDQDALRGLISAYRKENYTKMNLKGKTDAGVFKIMKGDITGAINASKSKQHNYSPIADEKTGKQILNTTFSNITALEMVDYSSDYKGDSSSGTDYSTIAKRLGFTNGQQLLDYMDKHPALMSKNNTDGRFMIQVPSNIKSVGKNGELEFKGGAPEYKMIGWSATNSHKEKVKAINSVRSRITKGDKDTKLISKRDVGDGAVIQTYHDGKSNKIIRIMFDANGKKIDEGVFSVDKFYDDENAGIHYGEVVPAYDIAHQKN